MEPPAVRRRWWRRPRLSVRALMVLVLIVGVPLGWFVHQAAVQRDAVRAIEAAGGTALYNFQDTQPSPSPSRPPGPKWLVDLVGVDFLANVTSVSFPMTRKGAIAPTPAQADALLAAVGRLHRLEKLNAPSLRATDVGMAHLAGLTRLRSLAIVGTPRLTDAGLAHLAGLEQLESLWILGTMSIEGPGLAHLSGLKRLQTLMIDVRTHNGLEALSQLTSLASLFLGPLNVSDEATGKLSRLTRLKELALGGDAGDNAGLARLGAMTALEEIQIYGPWITDEGLAPFSKMGSLKTIFVADSTSVTPAGLYRLQAERPDLQILVNESGRVPRERTDQLRRSVGPNAAPPAPGGP